MENKGPRVSIVTPTYNRADFLGEAIDSVLAQTYDQFEMIIVDDGSTDGTRELIERYADDPRIRYLYQENQGQSVARNWGIAESNGEFVCFLDSDNAWFPDKLARSIEVFEADPSVDVVYGDNVIINEQGEEISRQNMRRYSGYITGELLKDNCVSMNTTMTRRQCFEVMGGFNPKDPVADDYGLWLRISTRYTFQYVPALFGKYRVMANQISSNKDKRFQSNERILTEFVRDFPQAVSKSVARRGMSFFYTRKARYEHSVGRSAAAWKTCLHAAWLFPFWQGPWRVMAVLLLKPTGQAPAVR